MKSNVTKKLYYRITFRLASALSVGSGENRHSDSDVVRNSAGDPFVPGSSLAGLCRALLKEEDADHYFGTARNEESGEGSRVLVYDAKLRYPEDETCHRSTIRDCVGLDQWKTGMTGCKFDFETVEPGTEFVTYLEQNLEEGDRDILEELAAAWGGGRIAIGRKTMRGLGAVKDVVICRREFDFTEKQDLDLWLKFDMYREEDWNGTEIKELTEGEDSRRNRIAVKFSLRQKGGISIRRYTTQVAAEKIQPDAQQLTCILDKGGKETPYIPGTSWAGAFRHHMECLVPGCTEEYFGSCEKRSQIRFGESFIQGASSKVLTRNAVDRFTGGVVDNALFTEKTWYGGETTLYIEIPAKANIRFLQALAASLTDLHMGLLSVGGLTSVGRGIFEGRELLVNEESVPVGESMYGDILERLEGR